MSNPRDERASSRELRRHLQIPENRGRGNTRSRSPSPAPPRTDIASPQRRSAGEIEEEQFRDALSFVNPSTMATSEQLARLREQLRDELRAEVRNEFRAETAAAAAAIPDSIRKKPEIPPFDKAHVDIWIKRTENAFIRANIRAVNEKFAFLETKFPVGFNPTIDEFLYGNATDAAWTSFTAYLRKEYGATTQQKASIFIDGFKRDGRRPSQYAAALDDKTKGVTLDDVKKEMLLREMPVDVRRMLQERIEGWSFKDAAKVADDYFDAEGRPKHSNPTPSVNQVSKSFSKMSTQDPIHDTDDEDAEVSAVNFRKKRPEKHSSGRNQQSRIPPSTQQRSTNLPAKNREARAPPPPKQNRLCKYHELWGDEAQTCKMGCPKFPKLPSNYKAGRQA